jgi:integrase
MKQGFTNALVKNLKQPGRYTDAQTKGLNLQVKRGGGKYWTYRYSHDGKRADLSLGAYPDVSLKEARERAVRARAGLITDGAPPKPRKAPNTPEARPDCPRFREFAAECIESKSAEWRNDKHTAQWRSTIDQYANPVLGNMPIDRIDTDDVLKVLTPLWRQKTETASRVRGRIEWILAVAITKKLRPSPNPAAWRGHLETILPKPKKIKPIRHHAALPYDQIPALIKRLHDIDSPVALALEFLILNASRTSEITGAMRNEVSKDGLWIVPASRMKAAREHRVPLGRRSMEIIHTAEYLGRDSLFIYSSKGRPLSNMAMAMLLRRLGYLEATIHGFRSAFRTWVAEETEHSNEVAEMALAHTIGNKVEAAYRRGDLLARRREMMRDWENYCLTGTDQTLRLLEEKRSA